MSRIRNRNSIAFPLALLAIAALIVSAGACALVERFAGDRDPGPSDLQPADQVFVHFIDVGQGDAMLIQCEPGLTVLIDGGPALAAERLLAYLSEQGVEQINLLVATHPHEDHIGGLPDVFAKFAVQQVIDAGVEHTTRAYRDYQDALERERKASGCVYLGSGQRTVHLAANVTMTVLGPVRAMSSLNDSSIVTRLDFGQSSFIFMGDALYESEDDLLARRVKLSADVLKVSRHGSYTSTSTGFLAAVKPSFAVITVGRDNAYGHPHNQTLNRLAGAGAAILRTDRDGHVVFATDGSVLELVSPQAKR